MEMPNFDIQPPGQNRNHVQKISDRHREIIRRCLLGEGTTDIANAVGMSVEMVSIIRNSPIVRKEINKLQDFADSGTLDVMQQMRELAPLAVVRLAEVLAVESSDPRFQRLQVDVAKDVLDRGGHAAPKSPDVHLHTHASLEQIEAARARVRAAREAARETGVAVDAVVVSESRR